MTEISPPGASTIPRLRARASLSWSRFLPATEAEGPGRRSAVWVQGCSVRCPGCFNPHLWSERGGRIDDPAILAEAWVAESLIAGSEGITLLGGEPFDQAGAMAVVAAAFQKAGLTVMTFTGYTLEQLQGWARERDDLGDLLAATDLLADGPYLADRPDKRRPWVGSTNQGLHALTPAYRAAVAAVHGSGGQDRLEVRIARDGTVAVNGWADDAALETLLADLGPRADRSRDTASLNLKETA